MRTAVVRVDIDPADDLPAGIAELGAVVHRCTGERQIELLVDGRDADDARRRAGELCAAAFATAPTVGAVTFLSRGADEDALGVVAAFGVAAVLERVEEGGEEVAVLTLPAADRRRVPESRLHTAVEAALNCEVRINYR